MFHYGTDSNMMLLLSCQHTPELVEEMKTTNIKSALIYLNRGKLEPKSSQNSVFVVANYHFGGNFNNEYLTNVFPAKA